MSATWVCTAGGMGVPWATAVCTATAVWTGTVGTGGPGRTPVGGRGGCTNATGGATGSVGSAVGDARAAGDSPRRRDGRGGSVGPGVRVGVPGLTVTVGVRVGVGGPVPVLVTTRVKVTTSPTAVVVGSADLSISTWGTPGGAGVGLAGAGGPARLGWACRWSDVASPSPSGCWWGCWSGSRSGCWWPWRSAYDRRSATPGDERGRGVKVGLRAAVGVACRGRATEVRVAVAVAEGVAVAVGDGVTDAVGVAVGAGAGWGC